MGGGAVRLEKIRGGRRRLAAAAFFFFFLFPQLNLPQAERERS